MLRSRLFAKDPKIEAAAVSNAAHVTPGASGEHVAKIQRAVITLDDADIDCGELQESRYGPSTARAVLAYKQRRKIINPAYQTAADDIVGIMTIASLDKEIKIKEDRPIFVRTCRCKKIIVDQSSSR